MSFTDAKINKSYLLILTRLNLVPIEKLFEGTNLNQRMLDSDEALTVSEAIALVHNFNRHCSVANWPAVYGAHLGVATHGPVGYATTAAPTLGAALATFASWFQIRCDTYTSEISQEGSDYLIKIHDSTGDPLFERFYFLAFMRAFEVLITLIMGNESQGLTTLEFRTPQDLLESNDPLSKANQRLMASNYNSRLTFDCAANALRVPQELWRQLSPLSDPDAHQINLRICQRIKAEQEAKEHIDFQVLRLLELHFEAVIAEQTSHTSPPSLTQLCNTLHLSERSLIRKLKQRDTAYKLLLEQSRQRFAIALLQSARYSVADIADKLGYKEAANFCRAFKSWTGQSPGAYRRNPPNNHDYLTPTSSSS